MSLIKREPSILSAMEPLFGVGDLFGDFDWPLRLREGTGNVHMPRVDIVENEKNYVIKADLPGVKKEDVEVTLEEGLLTIKAETRTETEKKEKKEKGEFIRRERHFGQFVRRLNLGSNIAEKEIVANFQDGVLTVTVPKLEPLKPLPVKIEIG